MNINAGIQSQIYGFRRITAEKSNVNIHKKEESAGKDELSTSKSVVSVFVVSSVLSSDFSSIVSTDSISIVNVA